MKLFSIILLFVAMNYSVKAQRNDGLDSIQCINVKRTEPSLKQYIQFTENKDKTIDFNSIVLSLFEFNNGNKFIRRLIAQ